MKKQEYYVAGESKKYEEGKLNNKNKKTRASFAFIKDGSEVIVQKPDDLRPMQIVLEEEYGDEVNFYVIVRGVFDEQNIILFIGDYYMQVSPYDFNYDFVKLLRPHINNRYGYSNKDIAIWTGVEIGAEGEIWKPIKLAGVLTPSNDVYLFEEAW